MATLHILKELSKAVSKNPRAKVNLLEKSKNLNLNDSPSIPFKHHIKMLHCNNIPSYSEGFRRAQGKQGTHPNTHQKYKNKKRHLNFKDFKSMHQRKARRIC